MTEKEWLEGHDIYKMLCMLNNERKLRFFAVACCRQIQHLFKYENSRKSLEMIECYADGLVKTEQLNVIRNFCHNAEAIEISSLLRDAARAAAWSAAFNAQSSMSKYLVNIASNYERNDAVNDATWESTGIIKANLLREIFGNPFKPLTLNQEWLCWNNNTIPKIAQNIYDNKDFWSMNILADALEDSDCNLPEVLDHCRNNDHVKGCWVIDLILNK